MSKLVATWLVDSFLGAFEIDKEDLGRTMVATLKRPLRRLASKSGMQLREFACTIVSVAVAQDGRWIAFHLGDGGIIGQFQEGLKAICVPKKGEFANETFFITDHDASTSIDVQTSNLYERETGPVGFALFTDGVETSLLNRRSLHVAPALKPMLGWLIGNSEQEVSEAIKDNLLNVFRQKSGDDCTLALVSRISCS